MSQLLQTPFLHSTTVAAHLPVAAAVVSKHPASERGKRIVVSPYAKKLAKELKLELGQIVGTGPSGRIVAKDVAAAAEPAKTTVSGVELGSVNFLVYFINSVNLQNLIKHG
ncbi:hypothetical protein RYX36_027467 [Vicia faba]